MKCVTAAGRSGDTSTNSGDLKSLCMHRLHAYMCRFCVKSRLALGLKLGLALGEIVLMRRIYASVHLLTLEFSLLYNNTV